MSTIARIDFLKYRPLFYFLSFLLFATFITGCVYRYKTRGSVFTYSVDFTGGTQALLKFSRKVTNDEVTQILTKGGMEGVSIREFDEREFGGCVLMIRVKSHAADAKGVAGRMIEQLQVGLKDVSIENLGTDSVGESVGGELRQKSIWVVLLSFLLLLLYIWWRFKSFSFGMGAVVSLAHDAIAILTYVVWFDYEISLNIIAAILFVLGYSINDTIVVFSRIREHFNKHEPGTADYVANLSINETLRRTLLLSFATCLTVIALLIFGGEVLRSLSVALFIGMVFGTYSSIYIATPVMLLLHKEQK